ncbi:MAG: site-2 protease family protein [Bacteroidota bacterium]
MSDFIEGNDMGGEATSAYPPKPVVVEKTQNSINRSLMSLLLYALLFYFIFDANVAYIAAVLLVIIVHELGHFAFMRLFHYSNVKIFIVPLLGAFTSGNKQQISQRQLTLVILGGPVPGIIIGCILLWMNQDWKNENIKMLYQTFLVINLLNCLPFHPLDGGRLIETLFFKENFVIRLAFGIFSILALLLMFLFLYSPVLLVVPVLIGLELFNENKLQKIRKYLKEERVDVYIDYNELSDKNYWLIRDCLLMSFPKKYRGLQAGQYEYSVYESMLIQQTKTVLQPNLKFDLGVFGKIVWMLFYLFIFIAPIVFYYKYR